MRPQRPLPIRLTSPASGAPDVRSAPDEGMQKQLLLSLLQRSAMPMCDAVSKHMQRKDTSAKGVAVATLKGDSDSIVSTAWNGME